MKRKIIDLLLSVNVILFALIASILAKGGLVFTQNGLIGEYRPIVQQVKIVSASPKNEIIIEKPNVNIFPFGQCTWYVATRRNVTWNGNARDWFANAKKQGKSTGSTPKIGSIMVTNEGYYGHVAYVENVDGNLVTISEMNNPYWGRKTQRVIDYLSIDLIGFIY